jgi:hypothetical protein
VTVLAYRPAEASLGPADTVLDRVLMRRQPFGGRLVAAPQLQDQSKSPLFAGESDHFI